MKTLIATLLMLCAVGCAPEAQGDLANPPDDSDSDAEEDTEVEGKGQALLRFRDYPILTFKPFSQFSARAGQEFTQLIRVNEGVCVLSGVTGNFRGSGESVSVEPIGDTWYLRVQSGQSQLGAEAVCARFDKFTGPFSAWHGEFAWAVTGRARACPGWPWACSPDASIANSGNFGTDKQVCWLSKIGGMLNGGGEHADILYNNAFQLEAWNMSSDANSGVFAEARCLDTGATHRAWQNPVRQDANYEWYQGAGPVEMISADLGICYLTSVGGNFRGYGESVRISVAGETSNGPGRWTLSGSSYQHDVHASAHCVYFPQL